MPVRRKIIETNGVYFITFTCARWLPLFDITQSYDTVYKWFDYLKEKHHHIVGYVVMPNHLHVLVAFSETRVSVNMTISNAKRFMAYDLVKRLKQQGKAEILEQLASWVNNTQRLVNKQHQVFEPSFDSKECRTINFMQQKTEYMHMNPCKANLAKLPEEYLHSSAYYYYTGVQGVYPVITYMELQDIDLTSSQS